MVSLKWLFSFLKLSEFKTLGVCYKIAGEHTAALPPLHAWLQFSLGCLT